MMIRQQSQEWNLITTRVSQEVNNGGQVYYYNSKTGVTSWTPPAASAPVIPQRMALTGPGGMPAPPAANGGGGLPPGWREINNAGQIYYYNQATNETAWTKPGGAPAAPSLPAAPAYGAVPTPLAAAPAIPPKPAAPVKKHSLAAAGMATVLKPKVSPAEQARATAAAVAAQARQEAQAASERQVKAGKDAEAAMQAAAQLQSDSQAAEQRKTQYTQRAEQCAKAVEDAKVVNDKSDEAKAKGLHSRRSNTPHVPSRPALECTPDDPR